MDRYLGSYWTILSVVGDINTCMNGFVLLKDLTPNFFFLDAYVYVNTYNAHDEKKIF